VVANQKYQHILNGLKNVEGVLWHEGVKSAFDMFAEYQPERVILHNTSLTEPIYKCLLRYQPEILIDGTLDLPHREFPLLPGFDNVQYKPYKSDTVSYVGTYRPQLDMLNGKGIQIFGARWPSPECLGLILPETENKLLGGVTISFGSYGEDRPFKALGVGGKCLSLYSEYLYGIFGESLEYFTNEEELIRGLEIIKKKVYKPFDMSKFTYSNYLEQK
jgi:hypothetical protein